ncbi:MAG: 23S rRNA (adenine(2030)-N(6))-methyltransferase RlmJ [Porticoccaceae bacterium]|nr:23S rRNA (adenine(2030)-N(6))-methyltransferase RlmJ [Porticoccaceae bacterium]
MLSYRHAFHAGNYADVLKHLVLTRILVHLTRNKGPLCYIDTHAGAGGYALTSPEAMKVGEYRDGIELIWQRNDGPQGIQDYRALVARFNRNNTHLAYYPGSPWLAGQLLRPDDRAIFCELHPADFPILQSRFAGQRRRECCRQDGYTRSLALVPPIERRGLIMIDPSYEQKKEFDQVTTHIQQLHRRFATGVYALWYPIVNHESINRMKRRLVASGIRRIESYELFRDASLKSGGMAGTGVIVINPPWTLREEMQGSLNYLTDIMARAPNPAFQIEVLVPE